MTGEVSLRRMKQHDLDRTFQWRNDPDIYQWFRNQNGELDWHDHVSWFQNRPDDCDDWIILHRGNPVGVVSIANDGDVGIYVGKKRLWGKGVASEALGLAIEKQSYGEHLTAQIHVENDSSQHLFESHGFEAVGSVGDWVEYELLKQRWEMENEHGFMQGDGSLHVADR